MMRLQVMVIAPAGCQVDWAWAGRGPLISLQVGPVSSTLCREPWKNGVALCGCAVFLRSRSLHCGLAGWEAGSIGGAAGGGRVPSRVALRCYVLCSAVPCCALARCPSPDGDMARGYGKEEEGGGRGPGRGGLASAGLFSHAYPALPCPFLFCLFDLACPLPAPRPNPHNVFLPNVSFGTTRLDPTRQTWTLVDKIACLLALNNCIKHLHIASPVRHSFTTAPWPLPSRDSCEPLHCIF